MNLMAHFDYSAFSGASMGALVELENAIEG